MSERRKSSRTAAEAHCSRPTSSALVGKFDVCVKVLLNDELSDELRAWSREHGYGSVSDCLRECVIVMLRGQEYLTSLHADRIASLARNVARKGAE